MSKQFYVWVDLETTGLDPGYDCILEIYVRITDQNLQPIESSEFHRVIKHYNFKDLVNIRLAANPVAKEMHEGNGLLEDIASHGVSFRGVKSDLGAFLDERGITPHNSILAGSSVHFDRSFLAFDAFPIIKRIGYRNLDVSSVLAVASASWDYKLPKHLEHKAHRAKEDVERSIAILHDIIDTVKPKPSPYSYSKFKGFGNLNITFDGESA